MKDVSFLIPFRTDNGRRKEILDWNICRLNKLYPHSEIVLRDSDYRLPFNRSQARNRAFQSSTNSFVFFLDADTFFDFGLIEEAVKHLDNNLGNWVYPYNSYHVLNQVSSELILNSPVDCDPRQIELARDFIFNDPTTNFDHAPPYSGLLGMSRKSFAIIGGYDEEFEGWGFEDWAFKDAANHFLGEYVRLPGNVYHIWHPVGETTESDQYRKNHNRYLELKATKNY